MNKTQLAKAIKVTLQTVSAYERGDSEPVEAVVECMSEVLRFPLPFFYAELVDSVRVDAASFRKLSRMTASQRDTALAGGTFCVALNKWMEGNFELPAVDLPDLNPGIIDPEGAAAIARSRWGLGDIPIGNVLNLVESHGVRVFSLMGDCKEIDAFSFWQDSTPYICLGTHKTAERAVFDLAHELGHLILHRDQGAPRGRSEEHEADGFASCFLIPKSDVAAWAPRYPTMQDLVKAKHRWKVSVAALNYRLHDLEIVTDWHYRALCIEISRNGRDIEPASLPREQSQILTKVLASLRSEGSGRAEMASALGIYTEDLDQMLSGLVVSAMEGGGETTTESSAPTLRLV